MSAYAIVGLTYLNTKGIKRKAKAGSVFDDYREDDFDDWKDRGWARAATTGEKAEAAEKAEHEAKKPAKRASKTKVKSETAEDLA